MMLLKHLVEQTLEFIFQVLVMKFGCITPDFLCRLLSSAVNDYELFSFFGFMSFCYIKFYLK